MTISEYKAIKAAQPSVKILALRLKSGIYKMEPDGLYKRCARCKDYWPADSEFFYAAQSPDGLNSWCKACYIENRYPQGRNVSEVIQ